MVGGRRSAVGGRTERERLGRAGRAPPLHAVPLSPPLLQRWIGITRSADTDRGPRRHLRHGYQLRWQDGHTGFTERREESADNLTWGIAEQARGHGHQTSLLQTVEDSIMCDTISSRLGQPQGTPAGEPGNRKYQTRHRMFIKGLVGLAP